MVTWRRQGLSFYLARKMQRRVCKKRIYQVAIGMISCHFWNPRMWMKLHQTQQLFVIFGQRQQLFRFWGADITLLHFTNDWYFTTVIKIKINVLNNKIISFKWILPTHEVSKYINAIQVGVFTTSIHITTSDWLAYPVRICINRQDIICEKTKKGH